MSAVPRCVAKPLADDHDSARGHSCRAALARLANEVLKVQARVLISRRQVTVSASLRPLFQSRALDTDEQLPPSADDVTKAPNQRGKTTRSRPVGSRLPIQGGPGPNPSAQRFGCKSGIHRDLARLYGNDLGGRPSQPRYRPRHSRLSPEK